MVRTTDCSGIKLLLICSSVLFITFEGALGDVASTERLETLRSRFSKLEERISLLEKQLRQGLDSSSSCYEGKSASSLISLKSAHNSSSVTTFCDTQGWILVQQRLDNTVSFKRGWNDYKKGFGNPATNFWIGLEHLHRLTSLDSYELLIEIKFSNGTLGRAQYSEFKVGSERERYALAKLGSFSGTVYDALRAHEGCNFSTFDRWNVEGYTGGMTWAQTDQGGWWYYGSYESQLNSGIGTARGIYWQASHLKLSRMMIRKK